MAAVYKGRLDGPIGFTRTVAVKRLHAQFVSNREFVARFAAEARLAAQIHHANVVQTLDFLEMQGELFLILEYVEGSTLSALLSRARVQGVPLPVPVVTGILLGALQGLSAAHELRDARGQLLQLVHRDFSPQNVIVGLDGVARVLDFGIAKVANWNITSTDGVVPGKLAYMSPEQAAAADVDQRSDVFAAGIVLWEALTGRRLFGGKELSGAAVLRNVLELPIRPPSELNPLVPQALDRVVLDALQRDAAQRLPTARAFAAALQAVTRPGQNSEVADFLRQQALSVAAAEPRSEPPVEIAATVPYLATDTLGGGSVSVPSKAIEFNEAVHALPPLAAETGAQSGGKRSLSAVLAVFTLLACGGTLLAAGLFRNSRPPLVRSPSATLGAPASAVVQPAAAQKLATSAAPSAFAVPSAAPVVDAQSALGLTATEPSHFPKTSQKVHATSAPSKARSNGPTQTQRKPAASPRVVANCSAPTYDDAEGISHFKTECL
jgi:serine/threonine-protein kinase